MKNKKFLFTFILISASLVSCQEPTPSITPTSTQPTSSSTTTSPIEKPTASSNTQKEEKDFSDMYMALSNPVLTVEGNIYAYTYDETGNKMLTEQAEMNTKFSDGSYTLYNEALGDSYTAWKGTGDNNGYAVTYSYNRDNQVISEKMTDDKGAPLEWSLFENPFMNLNENLFEDNTDSFSVDLTSTPNKKKILNAISVITGVSPSDMESFNLFAEDSEISSLIAETPKMMANTGETYSMEFELNFSYEDKNEVMVPKPLKHESFHDKLKSAIDYLENENSSYGFTQTYTDLSGGGIASTYNYEYVSKDFLFQGSLKGPSDAKATLDFSLIDKNNVEGVENGAHKVVLLDSGEYVYYTNAYLIRQKPILSFRPTYSPYRETPIEAFIDGKDGSYYLDAQFAGRFAYSISKMDSLALSGSTSGEIKLTEDGKVKEAHFSSSVFKIDIIYDYSAKNKVPFDYKTLKAVSPASLYAGTYTSTFKDNPVTITISGDGASGKPGTLKVTWTENGKTEDCTDIDYFPTLDQIYFAHGSYTYTIQRTKDDKGNTIYKLWTIDGPDAENIPSQPATKIK